MSKLIVKKLASFSIGTRLEIKYNNEDSNIRMTGIITDTDNESSFEFTSDNGDVIYLDYSEILTMKPLDTVKAAVSVTSEPTQEKTADPVPQPAHSSSEFIPFFRCEPTLPQMRDADLKKEFDALPKEIKTQLGGLYNSLMHGLKNNDRHKVHQAVINLTNESNLPLFSNKQAAFFGGSLIRRAKESAHKIYMEGQAWGPAAICCFEENLYTMAGACAALEICNGAADGSLNEMFTILENTCLAVGDIRIVEWIIKNCPVDLRPYTEDLLQSLASSAGLHLPAKSDIKYAVRLLGEKYPNRDILTMAESLRAVSHPEEADSGEETTVPETGAIPGVEAYEKSLLCGNIVKVSWIGERGTIVYSEGSVSFRYEKIADSSLESKIRQLQSADLGGKTIDVCFELRNNEAVNIQRGALSRARKAILDKEMDRAWFWLDKALATQNKPEALETYLSASLAQFNSTGDPEFLHRAVALYETNRDSLPCIWQNYHTLGQIHRKLGDVESALKMHEQAESLCKEPKHFPNILYSEISILRSQYESTGQIFWLERLSRKSRQYIQYIDSHAELQALSAFTQFSSGMGIVYLVQYACATNDLESAEAGLSKLNPASLLPEVHQSILAQVQALQESVAKKNEFSDQFFTASEQAVLPESDPTTSSPSDHAEEESEEEEAEPAPYSDAEGWAALNLSKDDVMRYAMSIQGSARLPRLLAYLKAASELAPELFLPVYHVLSLAVDNPAFECDYSVDHLLEMLSECDADYPVLNNYCMAAACLRAAFSNEGTYDFNMDVLQTSIDAFHDIPELNVVYETLNSFSKYYNCSVDSFSSYHKLDTDTVQKTIQQIQQRASTLYQQFILTPPREDASFARNLETKKLAFAKDSMPAMELKRIIDGDAEGLLSCKDTFRKSWLSDGKPLTSASISTEKLDNYINDCWNRAGALMDLKQRARLQGNRRNNLRSSLQNILSVICDWYELSSQGLTSQHKDPNAEAEYNRIKARLADDLACLAQECTNLSQDMPAEEQIGFYILGKTASDLLARLEGSWTEDLHRYFYVDFLRSDSLLLDESYLPDTSSSFCALEGYNILARIRLHCEKDHPTLEERIQQIFSNDPACNNFGTARLIDQYLTGTGRRNETALPENPEIYIQQTYCRAKRDLVRFRENYILSISRGQIMQNSPFLSTLEDTVRRWYLNCCETNNYGFWSALITECYTHIHQAAEQYSIQLNEQLAALVANNPAFFAASPGVEAEISDLIRQQHYTVAEDWMNRVRREDFNVQFESSEAIEYLQQFWQEFDDNFRQVQDAGLSLRTVLLRSGARKDRRGGQMLIENWLSNGNASTPDRIQRLLNLLGWDNVSVRSTPLPSKIECYRVTERDPHTGVYIPIHPIADFGSRISTTGFHVACLYGYYDCDRLLDRFRSLDSLRGAKLILLDYALSAPERRKLARKIKKRETGLVTPFLVLDRVLLAYLASHYNDGAINRMLMAIGIPFAYYQPYVADSSVVMPPEVFIGRKEELRKIESPSGVNLIYGGRQLGKSSLFRKARTDIDGCDGQRAVLVELGERNCSESALKLSHELVELSILPEGNETEDWSILAQGIKSALRDESKGITYLLIMLDEADAFIRDCRACNFQPMAELKDIQLSLPGRFKFVLAGLHDIVRFNREVALGKNSVITHLPSLNVKPFETPEAHQLLVQPLSYLGFSLENRVLISQILATTNYFPGLIQMYCQKLIESMRASSYAGYAESSTPPYIITEDHIRRVLADNNFLAQIQNKFEVTLRLDSDQGAYYYTVALLIGWMYTATPSTNGYTADDLLKQAKDLGLHSLICLNHEQIDTLLQELYDLNVLRSTGKDTYLFASKNFHNLLGDQAEIFDKLMVLSQTGGCES